MGERIYTLHQVRMELRAARGLDRQDEVNYWLQELAKLQKEEKKNGGS